MLKTLEIDETLLQEALQLDSEITLEILVKTALQEYIQRRKRLKVIELFGTIEYDDTYDYKVQRQQA